MTPDVDNYPESGLWKDALDKKAVTELSQQIGRAYPKFDRAGYIKDVLKNNFLQLELKERIFAIAESLKIFLPQKYPQAIKVIIKTASQAGTFENWALLTYVEKYGLDYFDDSIKAMEVLTSSSTAEFAIRPFMIRYTKKMMPILTRWAKNDSEHIRRLAAEGSRPRGVWVAHIEQFKKDPSEVLKLLELLKSDDSLYVRKAVANNLNDISKEHPQLVIKTCKRWQKDNSKHTDWIIKHGCRSMLKAGITESFSLFGFSNNPKLKTEGFAFSKKNINIGGDAVSLTFKLTSQSDKILKLAIDYKVYYLKKTGYLSPKVFKLSEKSIKAGESLGFKTNHAFKELSTRKHYPGAHKVELIINGQVRAAFDFQLLK